MRCIRPAVIVSRGVTNISIGENIEKSRSLKKGLVLKLPRLALGKVTILDRVGFHPQPEEHCFRMRYRDIL
jgi:hypothetical protein